MNLPAVIGVVFVLLVGVIVWVIVGSGGDDASTAPSASPPTSSDLTGAPPATTTPTPASVPGATDGVATTAAAPTAAASTTAASTVAPSTTAPSTSAPSTAESSAPTSSSPPPPVTTAPGAVEGAVPGDLAVPGRPMQQPTCEGSYITVLASVIGPQASAASIADLLETYPGAEYLRTDQTCSSLRPSLDGQPIYVVYFGPFAFDTDACVARAQGPDDAYARRLSDEIGPDHEVACA